MNIIYRASNLGLNRNGRPSWFDKKKCFKSIFDELIMTDKMFVVFDGDTGGEFFEYVKTFDHKITIINIDFRSNDKSLLYCYDLSKNLFGATYFLEDDYLHTKGSLHILKEGVAKFGLVTLYDHSDRYKPMGDICEGKESIQLTKSCHWRTAESTTCTWACGNAAIIDTAKSYLSADRVFFRALYNSGVRLWLPLPGRATHVDLPCISPFVDWEEVNRKVEL